MKSIRSKLLLAILLPIGILWLLCAGAIYFNSKRSLYQALDSELKIVAKDAVILMRRLPKNMHKQFRDRTSLFSENGDYFYQAWNVRGAQKTKSKSLGELNLRYSSKFTKEGVYSYEILPDERKLRTISIIQDLPSFRVRQGAQQTRKGIGAGFQKLHVVVARDTKQLETTLAKIRLTIGLFSMLGLITTTLAVVFGVRRGLLPLNQFANKLERIDSGNLDARMNSEDTPDELKVFVNKTNNLFERLEKAFKRERRFGNDLAHEIRTPTAEIRALCEVGLQWPDQFNKEELQNILQSSIRIENTTSALLDLARLSNSDAPLETEDVLLRPLLTEILSSLEKQIDDKQLQIKIHIPDGAKLATHSSLFEIIIRNLVSNAVEYAPVKDEIIIRTIEKSNNCYLFSIENTAPELIQEDLENLFERFWRKDSSRTSSDHAGLGLRIVQVCTERLNYSINTKLSSDQRLSIEITT